MPVHNGNGRKTHQAGLISVHKGLDRGHLAEDVFLAAPESGAPGTSQVATRAGREARPVLLRSRVPPKRLRAVLASLISLLQLACGKDKPTGPDVAPPTATVDLRAMAFGTGTVFLSWTAPADRGRTGQAHSYEIRYSTTAITPENFSAGIIQLTPPTPGSSGTPEHIAVTGLSAGTGYFCALVSRDESGNQSGLSNNAAARTAELDSIPPAAVTTLEAVSLSPSEVRLTWVATGDDSVFGRAASYDIRFARYPLTPVTWDSAQAVAAVPTPNPAGSPETLVLSGLTRGTTYDVGVRARDEAGLSSRFGASMRVATKGTTPRVWRVYRDGQGDAPSIQAAIDSSTSQDSVVVWPGHYLEAVDFHGKNISLLSKEGPTNTIIDASGRGTPAVTFRNDESRSAAIRGFTITGGAGQSEYLGHGGGIYCASASPEIESNIITGNRAVPNGVGGGIYCGRRQSGDVRPDSAPLIAGNTISNNYAEGNGGGVAVWDTHPVIVDNTFSSNRTGRGDGGGLWLYISRGEIVVRRNQFRGNIAVDHGGGIYVGNTYSATGFVIAENLFVENRASGPGVGDTGSGGGIAILGFERGELSANTFVRNAGGGESAFNGGGVLLYQTGSGVRILYNILSGSTGAAISCFQASGTIGENLFWSNDVNIGPGNGDECPILRAEDEINSDPVFCPGNDFSVSTASPNTSEGVKFGAYPSPLCGEGLPGAPRDLWSQGTFYLRRNSLTP